jgi:hypothetical protein
MVGKWQDLDQGMAMEFFKEGTLVVLEHKETSTGTYTVLDKDRLKIEMPGETAQVVEFALDGDTMTITTRGKTLTLLRAK